MKVIKLILTLLGMHIVGSSILFGYVSGPEFILAGPLLSIFGWFFIPFEGVALVIIWSAYNPELNQKFSKTIKSALVTSLIFGVIVAPFIPKEENNELTFWVAGLLGGISAGLFAFTCIHQIKRTELKSLTAQNSSTASASTT